ncbi:MAG: hypothetical protein V7646_1226 [Pseudonocardia sp.]|jgi:hypothetical protein
MTPSVALVLPFVDGISILRDAAGGLRTYST